MTDKKYIITSFDAPVIFDQSIQHSELNLPVKSAGFVKIWSDVDTTDIRVSCYGESKSMGICSDPIPDQKLIENFLNQR